MILDPPPATPGNQLLFALLSDCKRYFQVTGIDIYPNMAPEDLPPNLNLQVDDLNSP